MLFPSRLRYVLYGAVASISLISLSVSAGAADGVFGEYFNNIIRDASSCGTNTAITGFTATAGASFGTQRCTTFQNIVKSVLGTSSATDGQAVVWFNTDGSPKYGDVNWRNSGWNISYTGGNIGIGTDTPGAKLDIQWGDLKLGNKVFRPGTDGWIRLWDTIGDYRWQWLAAGNLWTNWALYSAGEIRSDTSITSPWFTVNSNSWGLQPNFPSGWSMVTQGYGLLNSNPQDTNGSINVNDIYIRSVWKWASQVGGWPKILYQQSCPARHETISRRWTTPGGANYWGYCNLYVWWNGAPPQCESCANWEKCHMVTSNTWDAVMCIDNTANPWPLPICGSNNSSPSCNVGFIWATVSNTEGTTRNDTWNCKNNDDIQVSCSSSYYDSSLEPQFYNYDIQL